MDSQTSLVLAGVGSGLGDLGSLLPVGAFIVGLVTAAGYGLQRSRVTAYRERAEDAEKRVAALKEERLEDKQKIADLQAVVRIATGEVNSQAILDLLEHHTTESHRANERTEDLLTQVIDILVRRPKT